MKKISVLFLFAIYVVSVLFTGVAMAQNNCVGATYYDADSDTCVACPMGYDYNTDDGKTSITQCQIGCDAGQYAKTFNLLEYIGMSSTTKQRITTDYTPRGEQISGRIIIKPTHKMTHVDFIEIPSYVAIGYENGAFFIWTTGLSNITYPTTLDIGKEYDIEFDISNTARTLKVNGVSVSDTINGNKGYKSALILSGRNWPLYGNIYLFQFSVDGTPVFDMRPAQNPDNQANGMMDLISGNIFENATSGQFTGGPIIGAVAQCTNAGYDYYTAASVTNYGDNGDNRVACPAGYFTTTPTSSGASECIQCTGATYQDTENHICATCPKTYDYNTDNGKTDVSQCQTFCPAGTYLDPENTGSTDDYTALEYIESTSALKQYIETGYTPESDHVSGRIFVAPTVKVSHVDFIGSSNLSIGYNGGNRFFIWSNEDGELKYTAPFNVGNTYDINFTITQNSRSITVNGKTVSDNKGGVSTGTLKLFRNDASTNFVGRIYAVKIYEDNVLKFDLVPMRRNSDNVAGMLNRVDNTFFENSGSGAFVAVDKTTVECEAVGDGYWSNDAIVNYGSGANRTACTGLPQNASWFGNGTNANCPFVCNPGFALDDGLCILQVICSGATYLNHGVCTACPTGYDYNTTEGKTSVSECQTYCDGGTYIGTKNGLCTDVGAGFWAGAGAVNYGSIGVRNACSAGLTTAGYGHGADELADCGRILHIGDYVLYTKTTKPSTPAINIKTGNGPVHYIGVSPTNHDMSSVHVTVGDKQYTAFDDCILHGERDFKTNARVTK